MQAHPTIGPLLLLPPLTEQDNAQTAHQQQFRGSSCAGSLWTDCFRPGSWSDTVLLFWNGQGTEKMNDEKEVRT